jgi:integrase
VDLQRGFLTVEAAYAKNGETETVPLNGLVLEALKRLRQQSRSEFVFTSRTGQPFKSIRTIFDTARKRANLTDDVTPHVLRHTVWQ